MRISIITIFPGMFEAYLGESLIGRAAANGIVSFDLVNPRDFTQDRHRSVDDTPYGGGPGMVMKVEPLSRAIEHVLSDGEPTRTVLLTPQGRRFDQASAEEFSTDGRRLRLRKSVSWR